LKEKFNIYSPRNTLSKTKYQCTEAIFTIIVVVSLFLNICQLLAYPLVAQPEPLINFNAVEPNATLNATNGLNNATNASSIFILGGDTLGNVRIVAQNTSNALDNATSALTNATNVLQNASRSLTGMPSLPVASSPSLVNTTTVVNSIFDSSLPSLFIIIIFLVIIVPLLADMYISYKRRPKEGEDRESSRVTGMPGLYRSLMTFGVILLVGTVIYYLMALITLNINNSSSPVLQSLIDVLKNLGTILGTALATIIAFYFGVRGVESASEKAAAAKPISGDKLPPKVINISPIDGATSVKSNSLVQANFSEAMNRDTINTATFTVKKDGETTGVLGIVTLSPDGRTAIFDSTGDFDKGSKYLAIVNIGVQDLAGNTLTSAKRWSFTTEDA
jgi:Bacterial Ig-like domain